MDRVKAMASIMKDMKKRKKTASKKTKDKPKIKSNNTKKAKKSSRSSNRSKESKKRSKSKSSAKKLDLIKEEAENKAFIEEDFKICKNYDECYLKEKMEEEPFEALSDDSSIESVEYSLTKCQIDYSKYLKKRNIGVYAPQTLISPEEEEKEQKEETERKKRNLHLTLKNFQVDSDGKHFIMKNHLRQLLDEYKNT